MKLPSIDVSLPSITRAQLVAVFFAVVMVASMPAMALVLSGGFDGSGTVMAEENDEDGEIVYISTAESLHAYDLDAGEEIWDYESEEFITAVTDGEYAYIQEGEYIKQIGDAGEVIWSHNTGLDTRELTVTADSQIIFGTQDDKVASIDVGANSKNWVSDEVEGRTDSIDIQPGGEYFISSSGRGNSIEKRNVDDGSVAWKEEFDVFSDIEVSFSNGGQNVYAGFRDDDYYLAKFDSSNGDMEWRTDDVEHEFDWGARGIDQSPVSSNIKVSDGNEEVIKSIDTDGEQQWQSEALGENLRQVGISEDGEVVIAGDTEGRIYFLDSDDGEEIDSTIMNSGEVISSISFESRAEKIDPITAQVTDTDDNPVENATVEAWGIEETPFADDVDDIEQEIRELEQELTDPLPDEWDDDLDPTGGHDLTTDETEYVAVHENEHGFGTGWMSSPDLDEPVINPPADEPIILSTWDPSDQGLFDNAVDRELLGSTSGNDIILTRLDPMGGEIDEQTLEPNQDRTVNEPGLNPFADKTHEWVETELPAGVYQVHPEGHPETTYTILVGDESDLVDAIRSDLQDTQFNLEDRLDAFEDEDELRDRYENGMLSFDDLLEEDIAVRERATTNETGHVELDGGNVENLNIQAYKADSEIVDALEGITDPDDPSFDDVSISDIRDYRMEGYNGSVYLPAGVETVDATTDEPETAEVEVRRTTDIPYEELDELDELRQWLEDEFFNTTTDELEEFLEHGLDEFENEELEELRDDLEELADTHLDVDELLDELDDTADLKDEIRELQDALDDLEDVGSGVGDGEIDDDGILEYIHEFDTSLDDVSVIIEYEDGETEIVPDEYVLIESAGIFSGDQVVVDGFEVDDDRGVANVNVQASGEDGIGSGSSPIKNPAFDGLFPEFDSLSFNTLSPGPDERVSVSPQADFDSDYSHVTDAEAFDPDGDEIDTSIDSDRDRVSFRTDGEGVHRIVLTVMSDRGDEFQVTERIEAGDQSRSTPAEIRASSTTFGEYAVTGEDLEGARIDVDGDDIDVTAIAPADDTPGELHLRLDSAMSGDDHEIDVEVVDGQEERSVANHVSVFVHRDSYPEDTIAWRQGSQAITQDGDTRYGELNRPTDDSDQGVLSTYTDEDGQATITLSDSPGAGERALHRLSQTIPVPSIFFMSPASAAGAIVTGAIPLLLLFARRRPF